MAFSSEDAPFFSMKETCMACDLVFPVFKQYEKELLGFIRKRLPQKEDSHDFLNQLLLKIYNHCDKLPKVHNTRAWLYQITRNALADYYKEQKQVEYREEIAIPFHKVEVSLYHALAPLVPAMIQMLPEKYATPLWMSDLEGIAQKEIARQLGLSLSAVKSRIQRGREKLRDLFFECCYLELDRHGIPIDFSVKENCTPLRDYQPTGDYSNYQ